MKLLPLFFPVAAMAAPPTPPTPPATPTPSAPSGGAGSQWTFKNGASEVQIQTTGNVTLNPDSDPSFDLHGDGTLHVRERDGKDVRQLTARRDGVVWQVNGASRPFDAAGKAWLKKILKARPQTPTPPAPPSR